MADPPPGPDAVLALVPDVRYRIVQGEAVVLRQEAAEILVLNETAGAVLELLDGERSLAAVADRLAGAHGAAPEEVARDVLAFAAELVESGVVAPRR